MSGARRPSGSVSTSSRPIRISRPQRHGGVEHRPGRGAHAVMQPRRRDRGGVQRGVDLARRSATASSAFSERGSTSTRRTWTPLSASTSASRGGPHAGLDPDPALGQQRRPARASPPRTRFSETRSGTLGPAPRSPRARASTSPPVIQSPVEQRDLDARRRRRAARARRRRCAAGSSVSWPSRVARVGVQRRRRPRRRTPARLGAAPRASAGRPSRGRRSGRPGGPCHRGGHRGQQRRADQERPARADPAGSARASAAKLPTSPPAVDERVEPAGDVARARRRCASAAGSPTATARRAPAPAARPARAGPAASRRTRPASPR